MQDTRYKIYWHCGQTLFERAARHKKKNQHRQKRTFQQVRLWSGITLDMSQVNREREIQWVNREIQQVKSQRNTYFKFNMAWPKQSVASNDQKTDVKTRTSERWPAKKQNSSKTWKMKCVSILFIFEPKLNSRNDGIF